MRQWLRKIWWCIPISLILIFVVLFGMRLEKSEQQNIVSFQISAKNQQETVTCWIDEDGAYDVFLPSYAKLEDITVQVHTNKTIAIDGMELSDGMTLRQFSLSEPHTLSISDGISEETHSIQFLQSANVATMYIDTATGTMDRVYEDKENYENINMTLVDEAGDVDYSSYTFQDEIRGRGNSTWEYSKKPYNLMLDTEANLIGEAKACKWVLLANAIDKSNLRDRMIYRFADETGTCWNPETRFVDLYLNGVYQGLYLLSESVEADEGKLVLGADDVLMNLDLTSRIEDKINIWNVFQGVSAEICYPKNISSQRLETIDQQLRETIELIINHAIDEGSLENNIDMDSWVWKYLIEEIFENYDTGACSQYFYIQNQKLYSGPLWDYDNTLGMGVHNNPACFLAQRQWKDKATATPWFAALCQYTVFYDQVKETYQNEFLPKLQYMLESGIEEEYRMISTASTLNEIRWKSLYGESTTESYVEALSAFLEKRIAFLNSAWIDGIDYKTICVKPYNSEQYRYYAVERDTLFTDLPTPDELNMDNFAAWYDEDTGEKFDSSQPIIKDKNIYAVTAGDMEPEAASGQQETDMTLGQKVLCSLALGIFVLALVSFILIDYRRSR